MEIEDVIVRGSRDGSDAVIQGTHIRVNEIAVRYMHGYSVEQILNSFPVLSREKLIIVLEYLAKINFPLREKWLRDSDKRARISVEEVFTPRNPEVNEAMYIERPELERAFLRAIGGRLQLILHGDSGCGKTWLYQKLLSDRAIPFIVVDCASVSLLESFRKAFSEILDRDEKPEKVGFKEEKGAGIKIPIADANIKNVSEYRVSQKEPYERLLEYMSQISNGSQAILVLDNLEQIVDSEKLMQELGSYITLSDNRHYAKYNTKILIVGTPSGIKDYFAKTKTQATVSNRLTELPEVKGLTDLETEVFCNKGFNEQLSFQIPDDSIDFLSTQVFNYTMGIPQRLHELCMHIANAFEEDQTTDLRIAMQIGIVRWLQDSMSQFLSNIYSNLQDTSVGGGKKNRVIYAIGQLSQDLFTVSDVEDKLNQIFSSATVSKSHNVGSILNELAKMDPRMIEPVSKLKSWRFTDARYKICIRAALESDTSSGRVSRRNL